ncbi:MAG: helix-turn-helix domain-containing protein [Lachnospiraceae bacterium]|nr:helix-turn-helix domain-containing protein [Lachnospiraceae bacterium]
MSNLFSSYTPFPDLSENSSDILSVSQLAEYLGVGKNRIYELLNNGTIKGFRMGNVWKISREAVNLYIKEASGL